MVGIDIAEWLRGLGLEQYEPAFRDNKIDAEVLPSLTAEDLKEIGVQAVGDRRKLLEAIAALRAETAARTAAAVSPGSAVERRQLTVMFCDLVGSTALSRRLDPEDLREVIGAYHRAVADTVARFGGFVAKYMGDGVLVYFGYPQAHEDDAERAVRAALALVEGIGQIEAAERLKLRVGIATGLVVVGDLIGEGDARERAVVGETPNLAARLQALAKPDTLVISESTRRQLGALFSLEDLGPQPLAGFEEPQRAWRVNGESGVLSRFEALRAAALTPLVGREEEIELLLRLWQRAAAGEGQVMLICGEPGIGKSRLAAAFRDRLEGKDLTRLRYFSSPHHQDSALSPFISQLEYAAGFEREDSVEEKLDKLEVLLAPASPSVEDSGLIAELLCLPSASRYPLPPSTPQRKKEKTFEALLRQFEALARQKPVLIVFEDLHWIDPSSRELLERIVERVPRLPVLLVATFRPEFAPPWTGLPRVSALTLARLDRRTGAAMVESIAGNAGLSSEAAAEIVERADGVPLFVEELTRAVLEAGGRAAEVETTLARALSPSAAVPAALHASLMARLDRLGPAPKEIAQIAAAIGREFSYELLAPVAQRGETELREGLGRLADAGLIFIRGAPPHATYLFKHALVRDAAYGSLLRRRREELHARIAAVLETDFADRVAAEPELLARHLTDAGLLEKAVPWWLQAGEKAAERWANREAIAHLTRGLGVLKLLPETRQRDEQELRFQIALASAYGASQGFGASGHGEAALRAAGLCERLGGHLPKHIRALFGTATFHMGHGEVRAGLTAGEECLVLAERLQDPVFLGQAHNLIGLCLFFLGDVRRSRSHLEQALALYEAAHDRVDLWGVGDAGVNCHSFLCRILWHLGYPDRALKHSERAIALAEEAARPFSTAEALSWAAALHQLRGDVGRCRALAEADLAFTTEHVLPFFAGHVMALGGWAQVKQGLIGEGEARLREGVATYRTAGGEIELPHWLGLMAEACGTAGRVDEALAVLHEALAIVERNGSRYYEAELSRLEGELLLASEEPDETGAEASFRKAIATARGQGAKSFELRAATSLARLMGRQGRLEEAHALLAPVYAWFTEGFGTADLKAARALLDSLQ